MRGILILLVVLSGSAYACGDSADSAESTSIHLPSGKEGYLIRCDGETLDMEDCKQEAGRLCKAEGYTVASWREDSMVIYACGESADGADNADSAASPESTPRHLPSGQEGYLIRCEGETLDMEDCKQEAGSLCKTQGYTVASWREDSMVIYCSNNL